MAAFIYWSQWWETGGTSYLVVSVLFCSLTCVVILIQDLMHLLIEAVIPYKLELFLYFCVFTRKYFTVDLLNTQLGAWFICMYLLRR